MITTTAAATTTIIRKMGKGIYREIVAIEGGIIINQRQRGYKEIEREK